MGLGVIDDLQQELPVVIIDFLRSQRAIVIHRQQVPTIHLKEWRHKFPLNEETKSINLFPFNPFNA